MTYAPYSQRKCFSMLVSSSNGILNVRKFVVVSLVSRRVAVCRRVRAKCAVSVAS